MITIKTLFCRTTPLCVIELSTGNPSTPLRERLQTTARLLSGVEALVAYLLNLMALVHPPTFARHAKVGGCTS